MKDAVLSQMPQLAQMPLGSTLQEVRRRRRGNPEEIERERRYICSRSRIEQEIDPVALNHKYIVQSYFPKSFGNVLIPLAVELRLLSEDFRYLQVTQARLRSEESDGQAVYSLAVKGRCDGLLPTERIELPIQLKQETYDALLPHASEGTVTKDRFFLPLEEEEGELQLEIDLPGKRYVKGEKRESLRELDIAFLEVELPSRDLEVALKAGEHTVPLLHDSIDISKDQTENERYRKLLSWSRLARKGTSDSKLRRALSELKEIL